MILGFYKSFTTENHAAGSRRWRPIARRIAEHTEMIKRIRKQREEYTFKPMSPISKAICILQPLNNRTLNAVAVVSWLNGWGYKP